MTRDGRIPVPTNGHRTPLALEAEAAGAAAATGDGAPDDTVDPTIPVVSRRGIAIDASPAQLAVGAGVIASLILLLLGARRRRD